MALVGGLAVKSGKCSNFGNCSLADARKTVEVPAGLDFVCTECGKSLLLTDAGAAGGNAKALVVGGLLLVVLLAATGVAWSLFAGKKTAAAPNAPVPAVTASPPAAGSVAKPEDALQPPLSGNCSDADAQAGLCRAKP
ncbi:MAG: hypothetical protein EAZ34_01360 [Polaromonas sp.]|nr:MAG: hypothetical protein EAZ34_01360 [Polaromonas sp.]